MKRMKHLCALSIISDIDDIRPHILLEIFDKNLKVLLDSGASVSVLGKGSIELLHNC